MYNMFIDYMFSPKLYKVYTELRIHDVSIDMKNYFNLFKSIIIPKYIWTVIWECI